MNSRAFRKYYLDINFSNLVFALVIALLFGLLWSFILFCTIGVLIGLFSYEYLKKKEYYLYYNLGFTKKELILKVFLYNVLLMIIPVIIVLITLN